jgi:hypothetical protein
MTSSTPPALLKGFKYTPYGDDRPNAVGGALFLGYIVAALLFTTRLVLSIRYHYKKAASRAQPTNFRTATGRRTIIFSALSLLSFATLSFHMSSFLALSYWNWCQTHGRSFEVNVKQMWEWCSHSALFEDFARALMETPERSWWAALALMQMLDTVWFVNARGRKEGWNDRPGSFTSIAEILPSSFAQNLFFVYESVRNVSSSKPTKKPPTPQKRRPGSTVASAHLALTIAFGVTLCFGLKLGIQNYFLLWTALLRVILAAPYILPINEETHSQRSVDVAKVAFLGMAIAPVFTNGGGLRTLMRAANSHPAVSAFAWDAVIGLGSCVVSRAL